MSVCTGVFRKSAFGCIYRGSVSTNRKATDNIFTRKQRIKGIFLSFYVDLILCLIDFSEDSYSW